MSRPTFFFYDLETSGLSPSDARIMQFAGQRTSLDFQPLGDPVNLLVKLDDDTLPSPGAILTTKITPQKTLEEGIPERELAQFLMSDIFTPDTIILGFNSVRFDDRFLQHLFWRNFYDPYEWQWKDGRSRWDMLDVVRMTRALRPEGITWCFTEDGKPTNRLELLTKANGISHESAHDALSDVNALIDVTRLIKEKQPSLFNFLFRLRDKREVKALINLDRPAPFVYTSGRFGSAHNFTTVAFPLFHTKNDNLLVFDLRYNLEEKLAELESASDPKSPLLKDRLFPLFKELAPNKCPAVAPLSVLEAKDGWQKLDLTKDIVDKHLKILMSHPDLLETLKTEFRSSSFDRPPIDVEASLYDAFPPDSDKLRFSAIRAMSSPEEFADFHPNFADDRLPDLLLHYKAKNFPTSLSESEAEAWQSYRTARLTRQAPAFLKELETFSNQGADSFLLEELSLYYQSLQEADY
ncbi:exodeoxyribonuclease I [Candidatus Saccharibacteria bacterium]|nr:exodeoxyribonuclease I [Candidatus Saccharibacteria bacterium]